MKYDSTFSIVGLRLDTHPLISFGVLVLLRNSRGNKYCS